MGKLNNKRDITDHPVIIAIIGIVSICVGAFFFILSGMYAPIPREEAVSYTGEFDRYESSEDLCEIYLADGSCYEVYPSAEPIEFAEMMGSLEKKTQLHLLVNPNNDYVVEIKTDKEELLNFETAQEALADQRTGYSFIGVLMVGTGVLSIVFARMAVVSKRKEIARHEAKKQQSNGDSGVLRYADYGVKSRVLLESKIDGYEICYRRVKSVNELVINGRVYDEMKAIIEFEHTLSATVGGHVIEAGYDNDSRSFITFDGDLIEYKLRLI